MPSYRHTAGKHQCTENKKLFMGMADEMAQFAPQDPPGKRPDS